MDNRREEEMYRGRRIAAEADRTPTGWCWSYLIDGSVPGRSKLQLIRDADAALRQALAAARARVDDLEGGR
jgi:hypothetical protein